MRKKQFIKIWSILCVVGVICVAIWFFLEVPSHPSYDKEDIAAPFLNEKYNGKVIKKYVDTNQHNYHKLILNQNGKRKVILMDWEKGGLFSFIKEGDSLFKDINSLEVHIMRKGIDTTLVMEF